MGAVTEPSQLKKTDALYLHSVPPTSLGMSLQRMQSISPTIAAARIFVRLRRWTRHHDRNRARRR